MILKGCRTHFREMLSGVCSVYTVFSAVSVQQLREGFHLFKTALENIVPNIETGLFDAAIVSILVKDPQHDYRQAVNDIACAPISAIFQSVF